MTETQAHPQATSRGIQLLKQKRQLDKLSHLLDDAFIIPVLKIRIGWDAIIGFIPVVGDIVGALLSLILVIHAIKLKTGLFAVLRMLANIGVELLLGLVPVLGDFFDVTWRANRRNYALLERHLNQQLANEGIVEKPIKTQFHARYRWLVQLLLAVLCGAILWFALQQWQHGNLPSPQLPWSPNPLIW